MAKGAFRNVGNFENFHKKVSSSLHEPQGSALTLWSPFTALHGVYDVCNEYHECLLRISGSMAIENSGIFMMRTDRLSIFHHRLYILSVGGKIYNVL